MELLPGKFLESVPLVAEHVIPFLKDCIFLTIFPDYLLLTGNFNLCTYPMDDCGPRADKPQGHEQSRSTCYEIGKLLVFTIVYIFETYQK